MRWVKTEAGKPMPLDMEPSDKGNIVLVPGVGGQVARYLTAEDAQNTVRARYVAHFSTCPNADKHRKKKPSLTALPLYMASDVASEGGQ